MSAQEADDGQTQHGPHGSALDFGIHLSGIGVGGASRGGEGRTLLGAFIYDILNITDIWTLVPCSFCTPNKSPHH